MSDTTPAPSRARRWARTLGDWALTLAIVGVASTVFGWLRAPDLPEYAPDLVLDTLDGERIDLADLRGRPVVVNFWATWCGPCRAELPMLSAWAAGRDDFTFLAVSTDRDPRVVRRVRDDLALPFPVLMADAATQAAWQVSSLPTTVIVDRDGRVHTAHVGLITPPQLEMMLP